MVKTAKKAAKFLIWMVEGDHASTFGVFFVGMAISWYLGDLGVTGMPPRWMLFVIAGAFTFLVFLLNAARKELRETLDAK